MRSDCLGKEVLSVPNPLQKLMELYVAGLIRIYGEYLKQVILYGSYARVLLTLSFV